MKLLSKKLWKWQNRNGCPRERERDRLCIKEIQKKKRKNDEIIRQNLMQRGQRKTKKSFYFHFLMAKFIFFLSIFFISLHHLTWQTKKIFIAVTLFFQFSKTTHYLAIDHHSLQIVSKTLSLLMCWNCQIDFKVCLYKILPALMIT